jgi:DNA-binding response OmpR family regulator
MSLLVVDDEAVTRRVVIYTLKAIGINVIEAPDAVSALQIANQPDQNIEMMLIDINLPEMDGFTLIGKLRAIEGFTNIPIIVFTARNHVEDEAHAREVGAAGLLYKPFSTQELRALVTHHLQKA